MSFNDKILSIDADDDNENYQAFNDYLENDTKRKKNKTASEIEDIGESLLKEIDRKNSKKSEIKNKQIEYILKHNNKYDDDELQSYDFSTVLEIYNEIKEQKKSKLLEFIKYLLNIKLNGTI